jgi:carbon-monoxide dehydrogenase medium subunit
MWKEYISATSINEALQVLAERGSQARVVAGATDLILEMERGQRKGIETLVDVTRIPGLSLITYDDDGVIHLGPLVSHNHCVASKLIRDHALPLARACWEVGSPQIRNRGTIAGNLITASPANDTITPLMALNATVTLRSGKGGVVSERQVPLSEFYTGVRRTVLQPDEMLVDIAFPALKANQRGTFIKFALRQAQAIALVNAAIVLTLDEKQDRLEAIRDAQITLGAVAPTIVHALEAEAFLKGKTLDEATIQAAAQLALRAAQPISDVRGSAGYRQRMTRVIVQRGLRAIACNQERDGLPVDPVLLMGRTIQDAPALPQSLHHTGHEPIVTRINGKEYVLSSGQHKTLLRLIREDAGLIGSKEGCAEGECGACTVFLDGVAVMSCMVPAPRAHGAEIVTVEGLSVDGKLHPVQAAFIEEGAVQCGYCTPGFLMSAAKLLEERTHPSGDEIRQALTGNLCRCTGYYKIIQAIELAAENGGV